MRLVGLDARRPFTDRLEVFVRAETAVPPLGMPHHAPEVAPRAPGSAKHHRLRGARRDLAGALLLAFPVIFFWRAVPANAGFRAAAASRTIPADRTAWRAQWETGHALGFVLQLAAFVLVAKGTPS